MKEGEKQEGEEHEEEQHEEPKCPSDLAWRVEPLTALNTTFHVPANMRYNPKGPAPSDVGIVTATPRPLTS